MHLLSLAQALPLCVLVLRSMPALCAACPAGVDVLVDLNFRDHFVLPHSTGWYAKLLAALPNDWVGTAAALAPLVRLMSAGMRLCFKQAGVPLPPWREGRAVLSRWLPEAYEEEAPPLVPLPDGALRRMLAPYHGAPFRSALQRAAASELQMTAGAAAAAGPAAAAARCQAATAWDQQQLAGNGRPPLPRAPSGVVLATASVKAAAADAAAGVRQPVAGPDHSHHGQLPLVPDVPRKIIVGFPDQNVLCAASKKGFSIAAAAATPGQLLDGFASDGAADAGVLVIRQQQQQQSGSDQQRAPAAGTVKQQQADGEATVCKGRPAGGLVALQQPEAVPACCVASDTGVAVAPVRNSAAVQAVQLTPQTAAAAAAATVTAARASLNKQQKQQGGQLPAAQALPRPAFTSAVGVVTAMCSSTSPAVVISQQFLNKPQLVPLADQQQQQQRDGSLSGVHSGSHPTAAGAAVAAAAAADTSNSRLRQFKTLDQLLPRMRTVRLGAA
jgi:hypothetical protein